MNKKDRYIVGILFGFIVLLYFYTLLHEGGHALVAIMCGGRIDKLTLGFNAYVHTSGADFDTFTQALFHAGGVLLPVLFLIIALIFYISRINNEYYHICYAFVWLNITSSLLAWVIIPLVALAAPPPAGDDTTKFMDVTGLHPLIVSLSAVLLIALLTFLAYKKGLFGKAKEICIRYSVLKSNLVRKTLVIRLILVVVFVVIITGFGFSLLVPRPVLERSLSMDVDPSINNMKFSFEVSKGRPYNMNMKLKAKGILTDVQIYDENGNRAYQNICEWFNIATSLYLEKGKYTLVLDFLKDPASMMEYFDARGYKYGTDVTEQLKQVYSVNSSNETYPITFSVTIK